MKSKVVDMTKGNTLKHIVTFMLPMLFGNLFQQFYNMVDSMIVGQFVGADALAAVGATGSINFFFFSLCFGLASGIGIVVAQYFGAGRERDVKATIGNAIYIMLTSAVIMSVLGAGLAVPILRLMKTPDNIFRDAVLFMQISCGGLIGVSMYNCMACILRAVGDSKTPLYFLIVSSFINVGLDLLFVRVFGWGCAGAAIATVISQVISAIGSIIFALKYNIYFKLEKEHMRFSKVISFQCIRIGVPLAFQSSLIAISCIVLQGVVNSFGSSVVAAFTATNRIEQLVQQPFNSLGVAMSTFTGQNVGAGKLDRVKKGLLNGMAVMGGFVLLFVPLAQFGGEYIMRLFVSEQEVISLGASALKITSWFYFALGTIYVVRGMLNGAGDAAFAFMNGIAEMVGRIGFAGPVTRIPSVGVWGIWWVTGFTWFITGAMSLARYWQGKWKRNLEKNVEDN